jgi:F-type H+-transporting ATPase subunit epsilon
MITGKPFSLEIVTPEKIEFQGTVESVSVPGKQAPFQILFNHAPIVAELEVGVIRFNDSKNQEVVYATSGGFVQVLNNTVSIVVETAENAATIDAQRAKAALERAQKRLEVRLDIDIMRAQQSLIRAVNRLKIADYIK